MNIIANERPSPCVRCAQLWRLADAVRDLGGVDLDADDDCSMCDAGDKPLRETADHLWVHEAFIDGMMRT